MTFSLEVGPACLPFRYPELPSIGEKVQVLGWGTIAQSEEKSQVLLGTQLDVIDIETCQSKFNNVTNKQICTYTKGTDSCQADSGGPLLVQGADRRVRLFGIISYGKGCATTLPGVNTRVGSYLHWILEATQDEVFCVR
ncbi:Venom serine protease 34 [Blattella germanica]|nr:Venom serine protease 34 [Blattella germanica]